MRAFTQRALFIYALILTIAFSAMVYSATARAPDIAKFTEIDVERINIREPDGTIRLVLFSKARKPGIIVKNKAQPHPNRDMAGIVFYNDEGTETGGLAFTGMETENGSIAGGALSFDRYEQDQIVQVTALEQGDQIIAGLTVSDRSDERINFDAVEKWRTAEPGPEKDAYLEQSNLFGGAERAFFGRATDRSSQVLLRDAEGRKRLIMQVTETGETEIAFYNEQGEVVKRITADE